jgi:predicted ATP-dependent serine protease
MSWEVSKVETKKVVFICDECGKVSTNMNKCNRCQSSNLVECDVVKETLISYSIDVESIDLVVTMGANNFIIAMTPSNHRTHIVTIYKTK